MNREFQKAIAAEVEQWPGAAVSFETTGNQPKAKLVFQELIQKRNFPSSPGERRALANCLADIRRTLRGMGATRGSEATKEEDEAAADAVYRKPNDGAEKREVLAHIEKAEPKPDVVDQLQAAGAISVEQADAARTAPAQDVFVIGDQDEGPTEREEALARLREMLAGIVDGIYFDLPAEVYHAVPRLSASGIQKLCVSAGTFWKDSWLNPERPDMDDDTTKAQLVGRAYHTARLEPHLFETSYVRELDKADFPRGTLFTGTDMSAMLVSMDLKKSGSVPEQAIRLADNGFPVERLWHWQLQEWENARAGRVPLAAKVYDEIVRDMERIHGNQEIAPILSDGMAEVSIFWTDAHGIKMKARVDYLRADGWADFKTFDNTRGKVLGQALADAVRYNRYHVQAATYRDAIEAIRNGMVHIQGEASEAQRDLVAAIQLRPFELSCDYVFQEKGGVPNLLARDFPFYNVPISVLAQEAIARTDEHADIVREASKRRSKLFVRARQDIDKAKREFVLYSQVYEPGQPWAPIEARGAFDDADFSDGWLEGKFE